MFEQVARKNKVDRLIGNAAEVGCATDMSDYAGVDEASQAFPSIDRNAFPAAYLIDEVGVPGAQLKNTTVIRNESLELPVAQCLPQEIALLIIREAGAVITLE